MESPKAKDQKERDSKKSFYNNKLGSRENKEKWNVSGLPIGWILIKTRQYRVIGFSSISAQNN